MFDPYQQFAHLHGMANQHMAAQQRENDSRVSQMRQERDYQHDMAMQQQRLNAGLQSQQLSVQQQREKYGVLSGLIDKVGKGGGMGGGYGGQIGGFHVDGKGRMTRF
jgi:hypothetical protein